MNEDFDKAELKKIRGVLDRAGVDYDELLDIVKVHCKVLRKLKQKESAPTSVKMPTHRKWTTLTPQEMNDGV